MFVMLAACGEDEPAVTPGGGDDGGDEQEFNLVSEGRLIVGSEIPYSKFEFEKGGNLTGFDVELVSEIASRIGLEHDPNSDWISTDFTTIFQQLQGGANFDIIVAAVTGYAPADSPAAKDVADREKLVDFTIPYYPSLQSLTVNTSETPDIKSVDDLPEGARVGVQAGTTGASYAQENLTGAELAEFAKSPPMYQQLLAGQLVAVFNDLPTSLGEIEGKEGLEVVEQVDTEEEYAIAVAKDNTALKDAIDGALQEMFEDGTYVEIFQKYFPEQELPDYASE
jgi:polar amino acid transport system substrate-binding protein